MLRVALLFSLLIGALALPAAGSELEEGLQAEIEAFLAENPVAPGVVVYAVSGPLGLDWCGAAGTSAVGGGEALTCAHTFRIASNTKTYVAAAVLRLVEQGRLGLDDGLGDLVAPDLAAALAGDGYDLRAITLCQVLSHTAGLADHTNDPRFEEIILSEPDHRWTSAEQLRCLVEWRDPIGAPGEQYRYSDSGYVILGTIIESLTGRELGPAVRELVGYGRLGLKATHWEYLEKTPAAAGARAHQYFGEADVTDWYASFDLFGGGGIVTDARELALFMRQLLKGGVLEYEATLAAMTGGGTETYRLGLMTMMAGDRLCVGHQGFWNTFAFHVPALDLTLGGSILNHDATNGWQLVERLVAVAGRFAPEVGP